MSRLDLDRVLIDVGGVGYELTASAVTRAALPSDGERASLEVYTHVREDAIQLFGFAIRDEKAMFLRLLQVSGIGPKVAMAILSGLDVRELAKAIATADVNRLTAIPHVGKKTAERIVVELKEKIGNVVGLPLPIATPAYVPPSGPHEEAVAALLTLGYKRAEADQALSAIPPDLADTAEIVKRALKGLSGRVVRG